MVVVVQVCGRVLWGGDGCEDPAGVLLLLQSSDGGVGNLGGVDNLGGVGSLGDVCNPGDVCDPGCLCDVDLSGSF